MPCSQFKTIGDVQQRYNIIELRQQFMQVQPLEPSAAFLELYEFDVAHMDITSAAARQETRIYPILREVFRHHAERCPKEGTSSRHDRRHRRRGVFSRLCTSHIRQRRRLGGRWEQVGRHLVGTTLPSPELLSAWYATTYGCQVPCGRPFCGSRIVRAATASVRLFFCPQRRWANMLD